MATLSNGGSSGGGGVGTIPVEVALTELNETVSRLASHKGVETVQILNPDGDIITESSSNPAAAVTTTVVTSSSSSSAATTSTNQATAAANGNDAGQSASSTATATISEMPAQTFLSKQAALTKKIMDLAGQYLHNVEGEDEVSFIQIRSKSGQELMIAPHEGYVLAVHKR